MENENPLVRLANAGMETAKNDLERKFLEAHGKMAGARTEINEAIDRDRQHDKVRAEGAFSKAFDAALSHALAILEIGVLKGKPDLLAGPPREHLLGYFREIHGLNETEVRARLRNLR